MPVPKRRRSQARRDKQKAGRRKLSGFGVAGMCPTCGVVITAHAVCKSCGHYKGVKVVKTKTDRAIERKNVREAKVAAKNKTLAKQRATSSE